MEVPASLSRGSPGPRSGTGLRRPRVRVSRRDARPYRARCRRDRQRDRRARARGVGRPQAADVRGRRARTLLRPPRPRGNAATALRRASLGARRRERGGRRQLAGAGRAAVLRRDAHRAAQRHAPAAVQDRGAADPRRQRRAARRLRVGRRRRLPARRAGTQPRATHAGHRRDDPDRSVPPDHPRSGAAARRPGRPRHRQDSGRAPPRVVRPLFTPRPAAARARRRPEPHVHGVRLARPSDAGRGKRRATGSGRARGRAGGLGRRPPARPAVERRPEARRGDRPCGRDGIDSASRGARRAARGRVHPGPRAGRGRVARGGPRRARADVRRTRAVSHERVAPVLRGLRDAARRPGLAGLRRDRAGPSGEGVPHAMARPRLADGLAGTPRPGAAHDPDAACERRRRRPRQRRAARAPALAHRLRLERGRRAVASTRRTRSSPSHRGSSAT